MFVPWGPFYFRPQSFVVVVLTLTSMMSNNKKAASGGLHRGSVRSDRESEWGIDMSTEVVGESESFEVHGRTPLHIACEKKDNAEIVTYLCDIGADVNAVAGGRLTPLHIASSLGHTELVEVLATRGADLESLASHGVTALIAAAQHGHEAAVRALLAAGASVDHSAEKGVSALHLSAAQGHTETTLALLEGGASINHLTDNGFSALEFCALHGQLPTAQLLCEHGAARGSACELAAKHGHEELAEWFEYTADWITTLHFCETLTPSRARALLRSGANVHASGRQGGLSAVGVARAASARGAAPEGSAPWLVLRAAESWSPETHCLFPPEARARATDLLLIGYALAAQLARSELARDERAPTAAPMAGAFFDAWREGVLPHAVRRDGADRCRDVDGHRHLA